MQAWMWRVAWSMMADQGSRQGGSCPARGVGHRGNAPDMYVNKIAKAPQAARLHARQGRCLQCHGGTNMKIPSHYVRIPFDMGAAKHSPVAISHHGPSARAGEDRRWRYRLGRRHRALRHSGDQGRPGNVCGPWSIGKTFQPSISASLRTKCYGFAPQTPLDPGQLFNHGEPALILSTSPVEFAEPRARLCAKSGQSLGSRMIA
jgi:hypothetical protein